MPKQVSCHTTVLCDVIDSLLQYKINYTVIDLTRLMVESTHLQNLVSASWLCQINARIKANQKCFE